MNETRIIQSLLSLKFKNLTFVFVCFFWKLIFYRFDAADKGEDFEKAVDKIKGGDK